MPIRIANPTPSEWGSLIHKSHQTSVYVLHEWLDLHPVHVLGAYDGDEIVAGMVLADGHLPLGFTPYQGLLLTRREQPLVVKALLQEAEKLGRVSSWNAPSLVDARPFFWRYREAKQLWRPEIRYHAFLTPNCRPFGDLEEFTDYEPSNLTPGEISLFTERTSFTPGEKELLEQIVTFESVTCYRNTDSGIIFGVDAQDRGYLIVGWGRWQGIAFNVAKQFQSADLGGVNSPESNRRLRSFGFQIRTSYSLLH